MSQEQDNNIDDNGDDNRDKEQKKSFEDVKWTEDDDVILKEWVDKSACFKWLHEKSYKKYKKSYLRFMIPVIIISTLTGAANFALERIPDQTYQSYAQLIVGTFNIIAAIVSTVSQFLKTAELKEGHNIAAKSWDKFNRLLKLELQRSPCDRTNKREIFSFSVREYDRLVEISPDIPNDIIAEFKELYKDSLDLIKPEIAGYIVSSKVYEKKVSSQLNEDTLSDVITVDREMELKNEFINKFKEKYNRNPNNDEINEYLELRTFSTI
jgi:hypothetical protein